MGAAKKTTPKKPSDQTVGPRVSRPQIPAVYGVPTHSKGLLPWSYVVERLTQSQHYWVSTVSPDGRPHATPVDGVWQDDCLYFGGSPETRRNRNLAANPAVCVHLESGAEVVILHGEARLRKLDRDQAVRLAQATTAKYGYGPGSDEYETNGTHVFRPSVVFAWKAFPNDVTRWHLPKNGDGV